ncbi:MAG: diguanylate cyclase [Chromatiales bacterium]|nr:diguanylate cyclase [Chromatiales bacterium]
MTWYASVMTRAQGHCIALLVWLVLAAVPAATFAGTDFLNLAPYTDYFEETDDPLSIRQVSEPGERAARFRPLPQGLVHLGLVGRPVWFRIDPPGSSLKPGYLELANPLLDRATLYLPRSDGSFTAQTLGDAVPFNDRSVAYRNPIFLIENPIDKPLYLHVQSSGSLAIPLRFWEQIPLMEHMANSERAYGLYFGIMLAMLLYNLVLYGFLRDPAYLLYVLSVLTIMATVASINGLSFQLLWPESTAWAGKAPSFFGALSVILVAGFAIYFLRMKHYASAWRWPTIGLMAAGAICTLLTLVTEPELAIRAILIVGTATPLVLFPAGLISWRNGHRPARAYAFGWAAFLIGIVVHTLYMSGYLPMADLVISSMEIGAAAQVLLLSFALADHINLLRQESEFAQKSSNLILARLNEQLETLVEKRTAELAEAKRRVELTNAELEQQNRQLYELAIRDGLTGLFNRKTFLQRLEATIEEARRYRHPIAVLMLDLDDFKPINDTYGHIVGDQALKAVAHTLENQLRESDVCARFGGEEFVVLLPNTGEGRDGTESACAAAERLRRSIQEARIEGHTDIRLTVSIGATWATPYLETCQTTGLIEVADEALYRAKHEGKNRVSCSRACSQARTTGAAGKA